MQFACLGALGFWGFGREGLTLGFKDEGFRVSRLRCSLTQDSRAYRFGPAVTCLNVVFGSSCHLRASSFGVQHAPDMERIETNENQVHVSVPSYR